MPNVFISYAQADSAFARKLAADLRHRNQSVWSADQELTPGERWANVVDRAIQDSENFVVVLSDKSGSSNWIRTEVALALSQNKRVIPVFSTSQPDVPYILTAIQGLDLSDTKKYAASIERLASLLSKSDHRASNVSADLDARIVKARLDEIMLEHEILFFERASRIRKRLLTISVALIFSIFTVGMIFVVVADIVSNWRPLVVSIGGAIAGIVVSVLSGLIFRARRRSGAD